MTPKALHLLVVELPGCPPRHYLLNAATIRLGRVEGNSIVVEEETVSSRHCELRRRGIGYEILDSGSTNGTRVNGETVGTEPRELHEGDSILLGLAAKARFLRIREIRDRPEASPAPVATITRKLERSAINPVAAAVAKAARESVKAAG